MEEAKTIVKYGRVYGVAEVINRIAGVLLIPLYTHFLSVEDYGVYALVYSVTDFVSVIVGMGLARAMSRFYFDHAENPEMRHKVVSTALLGFFGIGLFLVICSYPLSLVIVEIFFGSPEHVFIFALAISAVLFTIFLEIEVGFFLIQKRAMKYLYISIGKALLLLGANAFFFFYLKLGVLGIVISSITAFGVLSVTVGIMIFRETGFGFSNSVFKEMLLFGLPLIPTAMATAGIHLTQRFFLNTLEGPAAVGIVALGTRLASLLQTFIAAPFYKIFFIRRFETLAKHGDQANLNQILLIFIAVVCSGGLFLGLFGNEIIYLIAPEEYKIAALFIPLLCLSVVIAVIERNFQVGLLYQKETKKLSIISIAALVVSIPLNYLLISLYGSLGAVLAYLFVWIIRLFMIVRANSRIGVSKIQLDWLRAIAILALASVVSTLGYYYWAQEITVPLIILKTGLLVGFVLALIVSPLLDPSSRRIIVSLMKKKTEKHLA